MITNISFFLQNINIAMLIKMNIIRIYYINIQIVNLEYT